MLRVSARSELGVWVKIRVTMSVRITAKVKVHILGCGQGMNSIVNRVRVRAKVRVRKGLR